MNEATIARQILPMRGTSLERFLTVSLTRVTENDRTIRDDDLKEKKAVEGHVSAPFHRILPLISLSYFFFPGHFRPLKLCIFGG